MDIIRETIIYRQFWQNETILLSKLQNEMGSHTRDCALQAITQSFFPRFRVTHTSTTHSGQIYIAVINYVRP